MASRTRLTDAVARQAPARPERYEIAEASGLALRVAPSGAKSWGWRYRAPDGRQRRLTLGVYPKVSLADARERQAAARRLLALGKDPSDDRPSRETVADLAEVYLERHGRGMRTRHEEERRLRRDVLPTLGGRKVADVTRREVADLVHGIATRIRADRGTSGVHANRVFGTLQRLFAKAVDWGWIEHSPTDRLAKPVQERARERVLGDAELARLWPALDLLPDERMRLALRLQLATGQRLGEVVGAAARELDLGSRVWTIPPERAKNGREHAVPLSPLAFGLVAEAVRLAAGGPWLFPSARAGARVPHLRRDSVDQAFRRLLARIGFPAAVPHDLRRSCATGMIALGVEPHHVEAVLNHVSGARGGVAGVYNRHAYEAEKRAALERWGAHLSGLCGVGAGSHLPAPLVRASR
jgi:integrase